MIADPFVRPDVRAFLDFLNNVPGPKMEQGDAPAARAMMRKMRDLTDLPVGDIAVQRDIAIPGPAGSIPARLYDPRESRRPGPAVLFFHGGGFVLGDLDSHAPFAAELARGLDLPVIAVDYRLAPEHPWPAAPNDCESAARWVATSPPELDRGVTGLVLAGDSAGGTLAVITAMALRDAPAAAPVLVQFPVYPSLGKPEAHPSFDLFGENYLLTKPAMAWFFSAYNADPDHWRGHPVVGSYAGLPPALVVTAGLDPLRDDGRAYAGALIAAGVPTVFREAAGTIHGFMNFRRAIPSGAGDLAGCIAALKPLIAEAEATHVMVETA